MARMLLAWGGEPESDCWKDNPSVGVQYDSECSDQNAARKPMAGGSNLSTWPMPHRTVRRVIVLIGDRPRVTLAGSSWLSCFRRWLMFGSNRGGWLIHGLMRPPSGMQPHDYSHKTIRVDMGPSVERCQERGQKLVRDVISTAIREYRPLMLPYLNFCVARCSDPC